MIVDRQRIDPMFRSVPLPDDDHVHERAAADGCLR